MFAHRKEVVLSSSLNAVFSALNDGFESEEGESECYVACIAGGFYRSSKRAMERRGREGIGAGHFSRHNLLSASSLIMLLERRSGQQRRLGAMSLITSIEEVISRALQKYQLKLRAPGLFFSFKQSYY